MEHLWKELFWFAVYYGRHRTSTPRDIADLLIQTGFKRADDRDSIIRTLANYRNNGRLEGLDFSYDPDSNCYLYSLETRRKLFEFTKDEQLLGETYKKSSSVALSSSYFPSKKSSPINKSGTRTRDVEREDQRVAECLTKGKEIFRRIGHNLLRSISDVEYLNKLEWGYDLLEPLKEKYTTMKELPEACTDVQIVTPLMEGLLRYLCRHKESSRAIKGRIDYVIEAPFFQDNEVSNFGVLLEVEPLGKKLFVRGTGSSQIKGYLKKNDEEDFQYSFGIATNGREWELLYKDPNHKGWRYYPFIGVDIRHLISWGIRTARDVHCGVPFPEKDFWRFINMFYVGCLQNSGSYLVNHSEEIHVRQSRTRNTPYHIEDGYTVVSDVPLIGSGVNDLHYRAI